MAGGEIAALYATIGVKMDDVDKGLDELERKLGDTEKTLDGFGSKAGDTAGKVGEIGDAGETAAPKMDAMAAALAAGAAVLTAELIGAAAGFARELLAIGVNAERVAGAFQNMAAWNKVNADAMLKAMQDASQGTVAETDLMLSANQAMMAGMTDAQALAGLMEIAMFRAAATGQPTIDVFDRLVDSIGNGSPAIAEQLGLLADGKAVLDAYAVSVGKDTKELTENERMQALLNAVMAQGHAEIAAAGGMPETTYTRMMQSGAKWEDIKAEIGMGLSERAYGGMGIIPGFLDAILAFERGGQAAESAGLTNLNPLFGLGYYGMPTTGENQEPSTMMPPTVSIDPESELAKYLQEMAEKGTVPKVVTNDMAAIKAATEQQIELSSSLPNLFGIPLPVWLVGGLGGSGGVGESSGGNTAGDTSSSSGRATTRGVRGVVGGGFNNYAPITVNGVQNVGGLLAELQSITE